MIYVIVNGLQNGRCQILPQTLALALIPLYNSVQCFGEIFAFTPNPVYIAVTVCANFVYAAVLVFAVAKMFASEKIMFSK